MVRLLLYGVGAQHAGARPQISPGDGGGGAWRAAGLLWRPLARRSSSSSSGRGSGGGGAHLLFFWARDGRQRRTESCMAAILLSGWLAASRCDSCSSLPTPREHSPMSGQQRQQCPGGRGKAVVLVGFIGKLGVLDRAFAKFLCDEQKALKDRRWELCSRFIIIDLKEASFFSET